jgi:hypothetical protein
MNEMRSYDQEMFEVKLFGSLVHSAVGGIAEKRIILSGKSPCMINRMRPVQRGSVLKQPSLRGKPLSIPVML